MKTIMKGKDYPTPLRLIIVMAVVIFSAKAIIMMFFTIIAPLSPLVEGLIDSVLITSILLPTFYFYTYCPMTANIREREISVLETGFLAEEFKLLIDSINVPIFGINEEGKINEWNQKSVQITGFQSAEVLGKNLVDDFITAEYRESVNEVLQKALTGDETSNYEFPLYTKDNDLVMVLLNAATRRNANGDIVGVVGVGQDITKLDSYRAEMERVADDLTQLIDTANAPIFGIDDKGKVNEWNQKSAAITGFSADEVQGKSLVEDFITAEYRESVNDVLQKALTGDETSNYEFPLYTKDNKLVRVLLNATTRRNANGDIVGVVGVGQDITELDNYRSEMKRVADDLTQLIDTANAPIFGIDDKGKVNEWNQKSAQITGFQSAEVLGKSLVEDFITAEYRESVNEVLQKALTGDETSNYEFPLYTKDNKLVMVLLNATTRRNANGDIVGVVGVGQDITELDNYRSEMERVADDLTQLIDTANAPIFGIDDKGKVNEWNQKSAAITGFSADEVQGKSLVEDFITAEYRESVNDVLQKALTGDETSNYEFPLYTKDNKLVRVLLNATTRRNANGDIVGVVGVGQDITELDNYRSEMKRVADDLTQLIDTANAPIFGIDDKGKVNEWNQKSAQITGFQSAEVLGKSLVEDFITAEYRESVNEVLQKALTGDETSNYEFPLYTKDNKLVMVLLNATTRRNANGDIVGVVGVGQDITELDSYRSEMETKIKERTRELDTIFTLSPDGFVLANGENNMVYINPAFLNMTGLKEDEFIGKSTQVFSELIAGLYDYNLMEYANIIGNEDNEQLIYLSRPAKRTINCNQRTMYGLTGEKEGQVLYFRDVTHEKEVDRMKSEFLSTAAHELRTPLASIYGFSELLLNRDYDKKISHEMIETIHRQSLNLKHLLDELLDLSRIEARAGQDFHMEKNALKKIVIQTCTEIEGAFTGRTVEDESAENWPILFFDIEKMRQVFRNLLSNGFKYSSDNQKIVLKTSERKKNGKRQFGISIIDNGIGMTSKQLSRIGERFYRVDESGLTSGTGLGLALVKEIISIHGGDVEFVSPKEKGMIATVWLPII
jgi:PAS domain S-box-containing protein